MDPMGEQGPGASEGKARAMVGRDSLMALAMPEMLKTHAHKLRQLLCAQPCPHL
jgi:hypothetical protein